MDGNNGNFLSNPSLFKQKIKDSFFGKWFTLVELIVVITILAILGTVGFVAMKNYGANARDSVRISDLKSNLHGLALLQIRTTTFPLPENSITVITGTGTVISYQGYFGSDISRQIGMNTLSLDPKDKGKYTYSIDAVQKKAQLMGYLESWENVKFLSSLLPADSAYAGDYVDRHVYVDGDMVGILTSGTNNAPLQDSLTATWINLDVTNTNGFVAYFWGTAFWDGKSTGTGNILISQMIGASTNTIPCNSTSYNGYTISPLAHNVSGTFTKPLTLSNGTGTGTLIIKCVNGVLETAKAVESSAVTCNATFVNTGNNLCVANLCTGSTPNNSEVISGTTQVATKSWTHGTGTPGACTFECKANYSWNNASSTCDANTQTASACGGSVAAFATDNSASASWTQTWNGTTWSPTYSYVQNTTPGICTYSCNLGYTWNSGSNSCVMNTYTVTGGFWANAANQTVSVCGTSVVADGSGNFSKSGILHGTNCSTISVSRSWYACNSVSGPASLTGDFTTTIGSCTANTCSAATVVYNTHSYSVPLLNSGSSGTITSSAIPVTNGTQTFTASHSCNAGILSAPTSETANSPVCSTNYSLNNGNCVDTTPPTITGVSSSSSVCNTVRMTVNGASDAIALNANAYSFDGGSTWQPANYKDYTSLNQTVLTNQIKVRDAALNVYSYASDIIGTSPACLVTGACSGIVAGALYFNGTAGYSLASAPAGTSLTASYMVPPATNTCQYQCSAGYYWNGSNSCIAATTGNYVQSNGSTVQTSCSNKPANSNYSASSALTSNACPWTCNGGYANNAGVCVPSTCLTIKTTTPSSPSGTYSIDPDGTWASAPFNAYCDMTTDGGGWTQVFYSNSNNVPRSSISWSDWTGTDPTNFSRLWSMRNIKTNGLYEFWVKDSSTIGRYAIFTQTNAYYQNPIWNSFVQKSWNLYYSSQTAGTTWKWLGLWDFWNSNFITQCTLAMSSEWASWTYCLQDQYDGGYNTGPWFYDVATGGYDPGSQLWVTVYQR